MSEQPEHLEEHELDTEEERDAYNKALFNVMVQFDAEGLPMPAFVGAMMLPHVETCPEIEAEKKELYSELHQTGDHFK